MYIYSEKTNKKYDTVDACMEAEKQYDEEQAKEAERKKHLREQKNDRRQEVTDAFDKAYELLEKYNEDYGSYTYKRNGTFLPFFWW